VLAIVVFLALCFGIGLALSAIPPPYIPGVRRSGIVEPLGAGLGGLLGGVLGVVIAGGAFTGSELREHSIRSLVMILLGAVIALNLLRRLGSPKAT